MMKYPARLLMLALALVGMLASSGDAYAQKKKKKKTVSTATAPTTNPTPAPEAAPAAPAFQELVEVKTDSAGYNPMSVRMIHISDIMYKMAVWRRINFREKCNEPLFSNNNEISRLLMDAVRKGQLQAYRPNDSLNRRITKETFFDAITEKPEGAGGEPQIDPFTGQPVVNTSVATEMLPRDLYLLELREDLIFDKQRSRQYMDIQSVTMVIPSDKNVKGIEVPLAAFRYKDLVKIFSTMPNAKWYNFANRAEDKKIADAMDLRLFCSRVVKMSNPKDEPIDAGYNGNIKAGLIASQQAEYDIVEKENELWDF